jgi:Protein of unknown function (DUF3489)
MSIKPTDRQITLLRAAFLREDRCLELPPPLMGSAAGKFADRLIAQGLVKQIKATGEAPVWRGNRERGIAFALKLSAAGVRSIAVPIKPNPISEATAPEAHAAEGTGGPVAPAEPLPNALGAPAAIVPIADAGAAAPRAGSKLALMVTLLHRSEGATIRALTEATGWLPHTARAALTGVRKRGFAIVLERGGDRGGSVYRLA